MSATPTRFEVKRFGKVQTVDVCPTCLGRGAKWIDGDPERYPEGRPQTVRDLGRVDQARAKRLGLSVSSIWPCVTCGGEGYR